MTPQPSRPSSGQSTRSITVDPQHSRPRTATAPEMATGMVPGIPRRGRDYVPASRTEKERHAARLRSQDFELAAISVKAGPPPSKEEFERGRNEARQRKMASDLEATLLTKLLARTPMGQRDSAAPKLLRGIFRHYDQDGDGTVTFDEFYRVAAKLGLVTQPSNNRLPAEEAKLRMLYEKHDESGCGYLGYERFCRKLAGNEMLDQGMPATMPYHQCKELEETVPRGGECGAALRGRIQVAESMAAEQLMARAQAASKEAEIARKNGDKGEFAQAAALVRQAKAAKLKGAGQTNTGDNRTYQRSPQKHDPPVAGYIPAVREPTRRGSAAQLHLMRDDTERGVALQDERQLRRRELRQRSRSPPVSRPPFSAGSSGALHDARAKGVEPQQAAVVRSEKDRLNAARWRQEDMALAAGRRKVVEQTNAIFAQTPAQRRQVREVLDLAQRQQQATLTLVERSPLPPTLELPRPH